jgi:exoribonuclease R
LSNTYTFETNNKGQELFEFTPINWRYPKFLVPSNIKKNLIKRKEKVIDYFVVIKFKEWSSKLPHGTIDKKVGPIDNIINRYEILINYYPTMPILKPSPLIAVELSEEFPIPLATIKVITIDPCGCTDIDDALSYDQETNRVGIHITDLTKIIPPTYSFNKYSTIYAPHKNIHMLPEEISTDLASLKEGKIRSVITCWIDDDNTVNFECNTVLVEKNLSYDEADTMIDNDIKDLWQKSIEVGKMLNIEVKNTHDMIEVYMIKYNQAMAEHLSCPIYRNQEINEKAIYSWEKNGHSSLQLPLYTHATSPIRRYVDIVIQRLFKEQKGIIDELEKVNTFETNIKRLNRMWDYMKASEIIESGKEYLLEFRKVEGDRLVFWCEALNIVISNRVLFSFNLEKVEVSGNTYSIGETYSLPLYLIEDKKNVMFYKILIQFQIQRFI